MFDGGEDTDMRMVIVQILDVHWLMRRKVEQN